MALMLAPVITGSAKWIQTACTRMGVNRIKSTKAIIGKFTAHPPCKRPSASKSPPGIAIKKAAPANHSVVKSPQASGSRNFHTALKSILAKSSNLRSLDRCI